MSSSLHGAMLQAKQRAVRMLMVAAIVMALVGAGLGQGVATAKDAGTPTREPGTQPAASVFKVLDLDGETAVCTQPGTQQSVAPANGIVPINMVLGNEVGTRQTPIHTIVQSNRVLDGYCLNVNLSVENDHPYCLSDEAMTNQLLYMLAYYPPDRFSGVEQAARQAVVWKITATGEVDVTNPTDRGPDVDAEFLVRYNYILNDVTTNGNTAPTPDDLAAWSLTVIPSNATNKWPTTPAQSFQVLLTRDGKAAEGFRLSLATSKFALSTATVVTDAEGKAAFNLTADGIGTAVVTATLSYGSAESLRFISATNPERFQPIGVAVPQSLDSVAQVEWLDPTGLDEIAEPSGWSFLFLPAINN